MRTELTEHVVEYGSRRIPVQIRLMERKRLRIAVRPDLSVRADAPDRFSMEEIHKALRSKAPWMASKLDALKEFHPIPRPHQFISGETFVYLGRQYRLRVEEGVKSPAKLRGRFLNLQLPSKKNQEAVRQAVEDWYRRRAEEVFNRYLVKCMVIASRHGVEEPTLSIRKMRTRWGSCSASGRVTLNLFLVHAPVHCIEYVCMHELCHLVHHDHSPKFYKLLTLCMPDWKMRKAALDRIAIPG